MRVGFDIGGTFTDVIVLRDDGNIETAKVLSLLDRVGEDIVACIRQSGAAGHIDNFVHGTTIASNAVIEGTTAPTGYITTRGFRDDLEMRGERRPNLQDPLWVRSRPLVPRRLRLEIGERILGDGTVERPLDVEETRQAIRALAAQNVEAIAVCLINSYLNPAHEREVARLILAELGAQVVVCLSSDIYPQIREYERASTTVINASLIPVVDRYLDQLEHHLSAYSDRLLVMQSNGGIMSSEVARQKPAYMIESGPAAGVLAAARLAQEVGLDKVLSFDMGGTTAKACLIENGLPSEKAAGEIGGGVNVTTYQFYKGGHALRVPSLDIVEVGAGGGSIAWIGDGGALRVGPHSAGAEPGPVCYARGGRKPTVTDANVVNGYMNPKAIAGTTMRIDRAAAWEAVKSQIADPLGLGTYEAAYGITQVANSAMMRALRAVSTERGRDPRDFTLVSFGGAGPIHAAALAEDMESAKVLGPVFPGLFSALGLLLADYRHDYIRSIVTPLAAIDPNAILQHYEELQQVARDIMQREGVPGEAVRFEHYVDLKYNYQLQELTIPFPTTNGSRDLLVKLTERFREAHEQAFGYNTGDPIELVSLRLRALATIGDMRFSDLAAKIAPASDAVTKSEPREAFFGPQHGLLPTSVFRRSDIVGVQDGPLIVEEPDTTVVVPPGWSISRDEYGSLVLMKS
ncbi:MAG: hydantoinase/oxoprolinase family protein [Deltaproteobacteria bacterium]|nr:hydantoinase/oxoprolinase family protein [Deltaproteobacteria bacterium]